jgi:hypothetical protein
MFSWNINASFADARKNEINEPPTGLKDEKRNQDLCQLARAGLRVNEKAGEAR